MSSRKLPLRFLFILSAISTFHASSESTSFPQQQEENRGSQWKRKPLRKVPLVLFFVISTATVIHLLHMATKTASSPATWRPILLQACPAQSSHCRNIPSNLTETKFTPKELHLLSNLISSKAPCNLLVFGVSPQFSLLVEVNARGYTIFLEDDDEKIRAASPEIKDADIYKIDHEMESRKAFELLKSAREDPRCTPNAGQLESSTCPLSLRRLPKVVYENDWDVVVVDGPSGENPSAPGRMGVIYSVGVMARSGKTTDVVVHDINRMIEKWYAWEFLCHENLASSKGKLWHFRIMGNSNSTSFCASTTVSIE